MYPTNEVSLFFVSSIVPLVAGIKPLIKDKIDVLKPSQNEFYRISGNRVTYNDSFKLLVKGYLFSNIDVDNVLREEILSVIDKYWR